MLGWFGGPWGGRRQYVRQVQVLHHQQGSCGGGLGPGGGRGVTVFEASPGATIVSRGHVGVVLGGGGDSM